MILLPLANPQYEESSLIEDLETICQLDHDTEDNPQTRSRRSAKYSLTPPKLRLPASRCAKGIEDINEKCFHLSSFSSHVQDLDRISPHQIAIAATHTISI